MGFLGRNAADLVRCIDGITKMVISMGNRSSALLGPIIDHQIQTVHDGFRKVLIKADDVASILESIDKLPSPPIAESTKENLKEMMAQRTFCMRDGQRSDVRYQNFEPLIFCFSKDQARSICCAKPESWKRIHGLVDLAVNATMRGGD